MALELNKADKTRAINSIREFVEDELDQPIGDLQAEFLLNFFIKELAPLAYNKGVEDARDFVALKAEDLVATCFEPPFSYQKKPPRRR